MGWGGGSPGSVKVQVGPSTSLQSVCLAASHFHLRLIMAHLKGGHETADKQRCFIQAHPLARFIISLRVKEIAYCDVFRAEGSLPACLTVAPPVRSPRALFWANTPGPIWSPFFHLAGLKPPTPHPPVVQRWIFSNSKTF